LEKFFKKEFPDYEGERNWKACAEHIQGIFMSYTEEEDDIYPHLTSAISTTNIKKVFASFAEHILYKKLQGFGFV